MEPRIVILPALAAVVGIASVFVDPKAKERRWVIGCLVSALVFSCGLEIYANYENARQVERDTRWNRSHITSLTEIVNSFRSEASSEFRTVKSMLRSFGWADREVKRLEESLTANSERRFLANSSPSASRSNTTVQYFPKDVDGEIVRRAIEELGFRMVEAAPEVTTVPTNAIWFGSEVNLRDVKLLAFTLMRAGLQLKIIRPYQEEQGRSQLIQVGADASYAAAAPLTVQEIREAKEFAR